MQATDIPSAFHPLIISLNQKLAEDADDVKPVLRAIACLGYNHVQHCIAERAGGLKLVQANITSIAAGVSATSVWNKRINWRLFKSAAEHLPLDRVRKKLERTDGVSRAFRMEPICVVNVCTLQPSFRSAGYVHLRTSFEIYTLTWYTR